jgi:putative transposase
MQKAYRFRAYPNREQSEAMTGLLDTHRHLYNRALAERKTAYETDKHTVTYLEQSAHLKTERRENPYLALANFSSCQRTLKRLDRAFAAFFRRIKSGETPGYPRFRGYGRFDSVEFTHGDGAKLTSEGRAYFQSVGNVKVKLHRPVEGKVKTVTFCRQAGRWYVVFVCDVADTEAQRSEKPAVGIDLGLKSFLVTSDGEEVKSPKFYRKAQKKLRRVQRAASRKKRGGRNRRKAVQHLARLHQHVANQRKDWHHKTALSLVRRYGLIAHEDLNVKGIARTRLAKSTHDAGWSQFLGILRQKAESAAVLVMPVNPRNTTQTCSNCGCLPAVPLQLSDRVYRCASCGFQADRDLNAAKNILCRAGTLPLGVNVGQEAVRFPRSPRP